MQFDARDTFGARTQEQPHFSFAETIDRLHWVTDSKHRASVIRQPAGSQPRHQFELTDRGVLELVNQQMMDAVIERQRQIGRRLIGAQCAQCALRNFGEVDLPARLEHQLQLPNSQRQQAQDGVKHLPLAVAVLRRRYTAHVFKRSTSVGTGCQRRKQNQRTSFPGLCRNACGEAFVFGQPFTPRTVSCQQRVGQRRPGIDIVSKDAEPQIAEYIIRKRAQFGVDRRRNRNAQALHRPVACMLQRGFELITFAAMHMAQPLVAARQHVDQQTLDPRNIVVEMRQQVFDTRRGCTGLIDQRDRRLRRLPIQHFCIFNTVRLGAEARQHRHLPRQAGTQGIDGLYAQLRGIVDKMPAGFAIASQRGGRKFQRQLFMFGFGCLPRLRIGQCLQHALAHFARGFFGERHRNNFFSVLDAREQQQVTLNQQFGFTGARRRLDNERALRVQRLAALQKIGDGRGHSPTSSSVTGSPMRSRMRQNGCWLQNWQVCG